ncbi:hypothetical protein HDU98_001821 [Podochytrium sp. JEL0797]|nr:hypothetical protein HDU98_001821 [Podochytrium sp. JEL0797]
MMDSLENVTINQGEETACPPAAEVAAVKKVQLVEPSQEQSSHPTHSASRTTRPTTAKRSKILSDIRIKAQEFLNAEKRPTTPPTKTKRQSKRYSVTPAPPNPATAVTSRRASTAPSSTTPRTSSHLHHHPRPEVPHDYGNPHHLGTHSHRCGPHLPHGTLLSHLARNPRSWNRGSTFGQSNRFDFLSAMGAAAVAARVEAGGGVVAGGGGGGSRGRMARKFWPVYEPADALGLTACGGASVEGRILENCYTEGRERDESRLLAIPTLDFKAARPEFGYKSIFSSGDGGSGHSSCLRRFQDALILETTEPPLPRNTPRKLTPPILEPPSSTAINTRYSANKSWSHKTNHMVEVFVSEQDRLSSKPWHDDQQERSKAQYREKIRHCVRDKNAGGELGKSGLY